MTYTQSALTGRTGARPITELTRRIARDLAARVEDARDIDRNTLYAILDGAKKAIGLGTPALETLKHLISYTRPDDWKGDRTPCAWPSNYTLAELAGVTESAIKARLRQLRCLALLTAHDSGHGRRTGRRHESGEIAKAYGLDLSPLRVRYDELRALAEAHSAQSRLFKEGRQEISRVRRIVGQALAQAADMRLTGPHWIALQERIEQVAVDAARARGARDSNGFVAAIERLSAIEQEVGETIDQFMFEIDSDGLGSKSAPSIHIQTNPDSLKIVRAQRDCSSTSTVPRNDAELPPSRSNSSFKTTPSEIMEMFPTTAMYLQSGRPTWPDLHRAAARVRHDLGIRTGTWVDAISKLGPDGAAVAVMITAEREVNNEIRTTAGAYFAGMIGKAGRNELDLSKSLWGFRTAGMTRQ